MSKEIKLSKSEMLFIRACKVGELPRLLRLRNRLYYSSESEAYGMKHLGIILSGICEKLSLISLSRFLHEMHDVNEKVRMNNAFSKEQIRFKNMDGWMYSRSFTVCN